MATSSDIPTTLAGTGPFLRSSSSTRSFSFLRSSGAFYRVGTRGPWWKLALRMSLRSDALVDLVEKQSAEASASALEQFKISADRCSWRRPRVGPRKHQRRRWPRGR